MPITTPDLSTRPFRFTCKRTMVLPFPPCEQKGGPRGTPKFVGFSPTGEQDMRDAIDSAAGKLEKTCCAGPDSPDIVR